MSTSLDSSSHTLTGAKDELLPRPGQWPVPPQEDTPISDTRIWIDGCFDFAHHGHAGAMLQARQLGTSLWVGVHSDESILENKGPTVMTLKERVAAVEACRWATRAVPHAPYVTSLPWISHYGCRFVVHGDDITSDSSGEDCYRYVKRAGRFKVVKRTPGISTTDLVGRMLLCTRAHFIRDLGRTLDALEGGGSAEERIAKAKEMRQRIEEYATDESGKEKGCEVWRWVVGVEGTAKSTPQPSASGGAASHSQQHQLSRGDKLRRRSSAAAREQLQKSHYKEEQGMFDLMVEGKGPKPGQRVVYVDGGFDLFSSGHIEFLKSVTQAEDDEGRKQGWFKEEAKEKRIKETGGDYGPAYVVAGVHDDEVINYWKGVNYPIMNIFERGLCVLQCKYVHAVVFSAPFTPTEQFLSTFSHGPPAAVYHGPTSFMPLTYDPYVAAKAMGIYKEIPTHEFSHVNAEEIVQRILKSRAMYEERQRLKGEKAVGEGAVRLRETMEREAERLRKAREVERQFGA